MQGFILQAQTYCRLVNLKYGMLKWVEMDWDTQYNLE